MPASKTITPYLELQEPYYDSFGNLKGTIIKVKTNDTLFPQYLDSNPQALGKMLPRKSPVAKSVPANRNTPHAKAKSLKNAKTKTVKTKGQQAKTVKTKGQQAKTAATKGQQVKTAKGPLSKLSTSKKSLKPVKKPELLSDVIKINETLKPLRYIFKKVLPSDWTLKLDLSIAKRNLKIDLVSQDKTRQQIINALSRHKKLRVSTIVYAKLKLLLVTGR